MHFSGTYLFNPQNSPMRLTIVSPCRRQWHRDSETMSGTSHSQWVVEPGFMPWFVNIHIPTSHVPITTNSAFLKSKLSKPALSPSRSCSYLSSFLPHPTSLGSVLKTHWASPNSSNLLCSALPSGVCRCPSSAWNTCFTLFFAWLTPIIALISEKAFWLLSPPRFLQSPPTLTPLLSTWRLTGQPYFPLQFLSNIQTPQRYVLYQFYSALAPHSPAQLLRHNRQSVIQ